MKKIKLSLQELTKIRNEQYNTELMLKYQKELESYILYIESILNENIQPIYKLEKIQKIIKKIIRKI